MMLGDIYGPGDFRKKLIPYLLNSEMDKEVIFENNESAEICLINIQDIFNFISDLGFDNGFEKVDLIGSIETLSNVVELFKQSRDKSFKDIRDESNREGIRVAIDLRNGVEPETIKRQLYKNTQIESSFGFNTLAIVEGKPKTCTLKEFLSNFL